MRWLSRRLATAPLDPPERIVVVGPYDQLILQIERRVPRDVMERLKAQLNEAAESNPRVIVLEAGLKLVAIRERPADVRVNLTLPTPEDPHAVIASTRAALGDLA